MSRKAFTLIELLVVIAIIALLASIVLASLNSAREKGRLGGSRYFATQVEHMAGDQAVGIWDFDGCNGDLADRSGYNNTGSFSGTGSWLSDTASGKGCALNLSGANYVIVPDSASLDIGLSDVTISAWVKTSFSGVQRIVSKRAGNNSVPGYSLVVGSNGTTYVELINSTYDFVATGPISVSDGFWHHVVGVIDRDGYEYTCVDGKCGTKVDVSAMSAVDIANTLTLQIGALQSGGIQVFTGLVDEVRVYAKTLSASEIGKLYASEAPKFRLADGIQ